MNNPGTSETSVLHKRNRFSSLKKSAGLSKAVRQKLSKTLHGSSSLHALEKEAESEGGSSSFSITTEYVPDESSFVKPKPQKKLSKLCLFL